MSFLLSLDIFILRAINNLPHTLFLDGLALLIHNATYAGLIYYPFLIFFLLLGGKREKELAYLGALGGALHYLLTDIALKNIFMRTRPFNAVAEAIYLGAGPSSYSFPSGQAATAFLAAMLLILTYPEKRWLKWAASVWALLVALDRVYLAHHYPSDVIAGALLGAGIAWMIFRVKARYFPEHPASA